MKIARRDSGAATAAGCRSGEADSGRRRFATLLVLGAFGATAYGRLLAATGEEPRIEVWTGPGCGCCKDWIRHLEEHGFDVKWHDGGNSDARARLGIPARYGSCHTAEVDGYAIEGHVPADDIRKLLELKPDALGLAVPAMPRGSPGMDGPQYGSVTDPYDVLLVLRDGSTAVFTSYR